MSYYRLPGINLLSFFFGGGGGRVNEAYDGHNVSSIKAEHSKIAKSLA